MIRCLLVEKVSIDQKGAYWMKCAYWKMKSHNCLVFLNVYMTLIYVAMWWNKEWLPKSQKVLIDRKRAYWPKRCLLTKKCLLKNKKSQLFSIFKCILDINLCSQCGGIRSGHLQIWYTQKSLLKCCNSSYWIYQKVSIGIFTLTFDSSFHSLFLRNNVNI